MRGFSVSNLPLNEAICNATIKVRRRIFSAPEPPSLFHYTRAERVASIIRGRALWGVSLSDQQDAAELSYAIDLLKSVIQEFAANSFRDSTRDILQRIPTQMEERKKWFFIACFCGNNASPYHNENYGDCCLEFPAPWNSQRPLNHSTFRADCWHQPIVYLPDVQRNAFVEILQGIFSALETYTSGNNLGPWKDAMANSCARVAAQHLLAVAVGFKAPNYSDEEEWRLVCCPRMNPLTSAPKMDDEDFLINIRKGTRAHVMFTVPSHVGPLGMTFRPPVPFVSLTCNPNTKLDDRTLIREALLECGRLDLWHDPPTPIG